MEFAKKLGIDVPTKFSAPPGLIQNVLDRNERVGIRLHGEVKNMDDGERKEKMKEWRKSFHSTFDEYDIDANQAGLYYRKIPNRLYVKHSRKKEYAGVKQMNEKHRVIIVILTAADGTKGPLSIVGKYKRPNCFRLTEDRKQPMHYTNQKIA